MSLYWWRLYRGCMRQQLIERPCGLTHVPRSFIHSLARDCGSARPVRSFPSSRDAKAANGQQATHHDKRSV